MSADRRARGAGAEPDPGEERRRSPRGGRRAYLIAPVAGVVTDLGPGGFSAETWEPLVVKRSYTMVIGDTGERGARLPCRVEWCRLVRAEKSDNGDVVSIYRLGVSFLGLEERGGPAH